MSSGDDVRRYSGVQSGRIVKSERRAMIAHDMTLNKDYFLRGASAVAVDFSKFGIVSGKKYEEPLVDTVCV